MITRIVKIMHPPCEPDESFEVPILYDGILDDARGEVIDSVVVVTAKRLRDGVDVTSTLLSGPPRIDGSTVWQRIAPGVAVSGETYRVKVTAVTSGKNTYVNRTIVPCRAS